MKRFDDFFSAAQRRAPFPWQQRLAERAAAGLWPDSLDLPTSCGKTAVVDIWLWARQRHPETTPRRLYYLVDRRTLVDSVADHAEAVIRAHGLDARVVRLRGGLGDADGEWMLDPARTTLVSTTVDQLGSRLLGRAYGAGRYSAVLHAGLAGNDALIVIDEAHLVEPLRQTLHAIGGLRREAEEPLGLPWHVMTMTATPLMEGESFGLDDADRAHPLLSRRIGARKLASLVRAGDHPVGTFVREALRLREAGAAVVGIVANTVALAREVHEQLARQGRAILVIGRARAPEREALAAELQALCGTGTRGRGRESVFVVATQTIEVGLDLDFDALVTDLAPISALRQRFGRMDRLGELGDSRATIVLRGDAPLPYGKAALQEALSWLRDHQQSFRGFGKGIDFGISALPAPPAERAARAPLLLGTDLELLFDPEFDFDVTPYLHGERRMLDVQIVWRDALDAEAREDWTEAVEAAPPCGIEMLPLPVSAARAWLRGAAADVADLEGGPTGEEQHAEGPRPCVLWNGEEATLAASAADLRAGMIVVVPASYGGCDRFGWHPRSRAPVVDLLAQGRARVRRWAGNNARTRRAIGLADHLKGVGEKALALARGCGLPEDLAHAVAEAARLHDLGKNDARYQLMLGAMDELLAKSGPHEARVSRALAGLPPGWRHEVASLAQRPACAPLVRYLIGTHHGRGQPWLPESPDLPLWREAGGADWPLLARRMRECHGWWGIAYLAALVRLADWVRSAEEQADETTLEEVAA